MFISIILILTSILAFLLALIVLTAGARLVERVSFAIFAISMAVWSSGIGIFLLTTNTFVAMWAATEYYTSAVALLYGLISFSYIFVQDKKISIRRLTSFLAIVSLPIALMLYIVISPDGLIQGVNLVNSHSVVLRQDSYLWFTLLYILGGVLVLTILLRAPLHHVSAEKKIQRTAIRWIIGIGLPAAAFFNLILPLFSNYSFVVIGPLFVLPAVIVFFYVIMKHSLFDVRLAFVRTLAYASLIATLAAIYFALAYLVSGFVLGHATAPGQTIVNITLALVLVLIFQPLKRFFDRVTNAIFYHATYNASEFYARLAGKLSTITDLGELLRYSASAIQTTLKANFGAFYIYRNDLQPVFISTDNEQIVFPRDDMEALGRYILNHHHKEIVVTSILADEERTLSLRRLLISHRIAVTLPLFQDDEIIGYFFLGDHLSSQYTLSDIKALETIADELTIAIKNALSVQTVRDLNATLQQRIDNATKELRRTNEQLVRLDEVKDEFMSMASHQLRTPLTTIKGYISMVIEGDAGAITPAQKHLLSEAFASSERMVHLIADFLNVSRLQTGKFMIEKIPTNLAKVVAQEIEELKPNAAARGIKFVYKQPKAFPMLYLDDTKIRQVIMNFADNAMYYSDTDSTVTITLKTTRSDVIFTVEDEGIGVPKAQQDELFQKFFRASNARTKRPDGTGVGLFLAKKVIDGHGGSIIFQSTEGKGSTFGFRLPLKKLKVDEV